MRDAFTLDPDVVHLNHGSFGAVPRVVQEERRRILSRAEANPMHFFRVEQRERIEESRHAAAGFLGVGESDLALVKNVTESIATVLAGMARAGLLGEDDVVVVNSHGYGAVRLAAERWCERTGARLRTVALPVGAGDEEVVALHRQTIEEETGRVRLLVVDTVTSPTGTALPVEKLAALAQEHDALVFADGAHSPGHQDVSPAASGADFWTGALHKWAYAPRGTSVLWVGQRVRDLVEPLVTSWSRDELFPRPFDVRGTDDHNGWMSLRAALGFWVDIGGWAAVAERRRMLDDAADQVRAAVSPAGVPVPATPAPCLRLVPLPEGAATTDASADALYRELSSRGVEAMPVAHAGRGYVRLSAAPYNRPDDYARLVDELRRVI